MADSADNRPGSIVRRSLLAAALALSGCGGAPHGGPTVVSAIGGPARLADPSRGDPGFPSQLLLDSTAQGLVRLDASGQIEPGLAERWIVIDDGTGYIFRLADTDWSDGKPVTADEAVAILERQLAPGSRNPLAPFLGAVTSIKAMTQQVIEIRLSAPRADFLHLLAAPQMAIFRQYPPGGSGPFRIDAGRRNDGKATAAPGLLLHPAIDSSGDDDEDDAKPGPDRDIRLIGERAARAIVRFEDRRTDLVAGGTFADWPLLDAADLPRNTVRIDPAAGLFGLAIVERSGFLADAAGRAAVDAAIDRQAVGAMFGSDWRPIERILPTAIDSAAPPAQPGWAGQSLAQRRDAARAAVAIWKHDHPGAITLRIAVPDGPGGTLLYGAVGASLISIGIQPQRVSLTADADLRLVDAVAPFDGARWYLATACGPCGTDAQKALDDARAAPDPARRGVALAAADAALAKDVAFIPLAQPLRWSLVSPRLDQWQANPHAWHPLNRLRADPN